MESIVKFLEKGQPYFDKVSKNIYLQAIKDGFLAAMPIILSSSVFLLISTLPGVVATVGGFTLPDWWNVDLVNFCNKVYNFTMGVVGIMVAGTTASALTGSKNRRMPAGKAITFALGEEEADLSAHDLKPLPTGMSFELRVRGEAPRAVVLNVPGAHNVANALAALGAVKALGVSVDAAVAALEPVYRDLHLALRRDASASAAEAIADLVQARA